MIRLCRRETEVIERQRNATTAPTIINRQRFRRW